MQTLYIDVYFLINLTVDFIALYFASVFSKVPTTANRLLLGAFVGGVISVMIVLLPEVWFLKLLVGFLGLPVIVVLSTKRVSLQRRIKVGFAFLIFGALLGAAVYYFYGLLDKYIYNLFDPEDGGVANRKLLLFAMIVLLSIGVFKMLISFFNNIESEGSLELEIKLLDKTVRTEAFIDSGNLAIDPMDMNPILFIKSEFAGCFLPEAVVELGDPDKLEKEMRKRIRLIPISKIEGTHVLTGIKPDSVRIIRKDSSFEEISVTIAIDREAGTYGGFFALIPSAVTGSIKR